MADPTAAVAGDGVIDMIGILPDPATSSWLRDAIVVAIERDPERDVLVLADSLTRRLGVLIVRHFPLAR